MPANNPITVRDSDLCQINHSYLEIHFWYRFEGIKGVHQGDMSGDRFFDSLPELTRLTYNTLQQYWHAVDPKLRDRQVAEHLYRIQIGQLLAA